MLPREMSRALCAVLFCATPLACASSPPPASAPSTAPDIAAAPGSSLGAPPAASGAPAPEVAATPQRPLDLTNGCSHDMHVYYGEQPGDGKGQAATVSASAVVPVPRNADGTVVVWVTDEKGSGLASVHVTKHMRHVRIDTGCMKIDADSVR
jgi:hypothetical protein